MKTLILSAADRNAPVTAAKIIQAGGLVAIPTETVYGLGANAMDAEAVAKIFLAKGRPQDNPLIIHISCAEELNLYCHDIPEAAWLLASHFWPGPLTMVLPVRDCIPKQTTAGLNTVAVRCPKSEVTRALIREAGVPIAAPSANLSGKPSTTTAEHVLNDYGTDGKIDAIIDGGPCEVGVESTIVDLTGKKPRLLRPGGVTPEELTALLGELEVDRAVLGQISNDAVVRAPGMKYKHYAPSAEVYIISGSSEAAAAYIRRRFADGDAVLCYKEELPLYEGCNPTAYGSIQDIKTLSSGLFAALRALDRPEIKTIYARCPEGGGVAYAVGNRLKKAAAFRIVNAEAEE